VAALAAGAHGAAAGGRQHARAGGHGLHEQQVRLREGRAAGVAQAGCHGAGSAACPPRCRPQSPRRGRQNVASYLALDLGIDWRRGAALFEQLLLDYDVASNWGNWLAAAGQAGGRINHFNITKQSKVGRGRRAASCRCQPPAAQAPRRAPPLAQTNPRRKSGRPPAPLHPSIPPPPRRTTTRRASTSTPGCPSSRRCRHSVSTSPG
jgi:hypothetical protein